MTTKSRIGILAGIIAVLGTLTIAIGMINMSHNLGMQTADARHQCSQSEIKSCGPASVVSLLSWLGIVVTERDAEVLCKTTIRKGTYLTNIAEGLRTKVPGAKVTILRYLPRPTAGALYIVDIDPNPLEEHEAMHAICARGIDNNRWYVNDPAREEPETWTAEDMDHVIRAIQVIPP